MSGDGNTAQGTYRPATEDLVARARAALARGDITAAQRDADAVLRSPASPAARAGAMLVAGDAAYRTGAYQRAAGYYGEIIARHGDRPEARRAAFALGWADVRMGERDRARRTWTRFTESYPTDERAPFALLLAAELARQGNDLATSRRLLDRLLAQYPKSPYVGIARLTGATVALQQQRDDEAVRDLEAVVRTTGPWVLSARSRLEAALVPAGNERGLELAPAQSPGERAYSTVNGEDRLEPFATALLDRQHRERNPHVLRGFALLAASDRGWADVTTAALASRLVEDFPSYAPAAPLLTRVASAAAAAGQWPIARRAHETLVARVPAAATAETRLQLAEAQLRTGAAAEARPRLEELASARGREAPRALLLLVEMHEARGDRPAAIAALRRLVQVGQGEVAAEAAYRLGEGLRAEGQHAAAVEWYLTSAYVAERSRWARLSLLGAGRSLTALRETREALGAYWKLVVKRPGFNPADDRETSGEAAYLAAEILRDGGLHQEALEMFAMSAQLTAGSPREPRALLGALRCFVALGDGASADHTYRRLSAAKGANPAILAEARQALTGSRHDAESALPKTVR